MKEQLPIPQEIFPVPQAERIIGEQNISPTEVKKMEEDLNIILSDENGQVITDVKEVLRKIFYEVGPRNIGDLELPKTSEDIERIHEIKGVVEEFARCYGRTSFIDLPDDNIHFLKDGGVKEYTKNRLAVGSNASVLGQIFIDRRDDISTAITTFHELWHALASRIEIQVTQKGQIYDYRGGLTVYNRLGEEKQFYRLDEALTGKMTERFFNESLRENPKYKDLIKEKDQKGETVDTTRKDEASDFETIVEYIFQKNSQEFKTKEDVWDMFFRAQVTGDVAPVEDLVERTFGKGAFLRIEKALESCFSSSETTEDGII